MGEGSPAGTPAQRVPWWQAIAFGRRPERTLLRILVLVVVSVVVFKFVLLPIRVEGPSMLPTYSDHGVNFVNKLAYAFHEPRRGDVVAIRMSGEHIMLMKRIIGLPGDTVEFRHGHTYINGNRLDEPYVKNRWNWVQKPEILGTAEYYVVGDNRSMPIGDHTQGKADRSRIVGKVLL
jgi:signal peptidase I